MAKKRTRGRPTVPKSKAFAKTFGARLKQDDEKQVLQAIKSSGLKASDWIRAALVEKAQRSEGAKRGTPPPMQ